MAFYKDINKQDRQQKRQQAEQRGGFDDEGSRYAGQRGGKGRTHDKPQRGGAPQGQAPRDGQQGRFQREGQAPRDGQRSGEQGRYQRGNASGPVRFVKGAPQTYRDRGAGTTPASYDDRRQAQRGEGRPSYGKPAYGRPEGSEARRYGRPVTEQGPRGPYREGAPRADIDKTRGGDPERNRARFDASRAPRRDDDTRRDAPRARRVPGDFAPASKDYNTFRYQAAPAPAPVAAPPEEDMAPENLLCGRNPIREALKSGRDIEKLLVQKGELTGSAREILQLAKELRVPVQEVEKAHLDALARSHQGMVAYASAYQYHTVDDMLALARERGEEPFLVLLDGITDPHNLGAIIRTAECAGAHGVIVSERRAVGLTPAAVKASAGAVEHLPVARVVNLGQTLESLKEQGVWSFAADMEGEDYRQADFSGPVALVIGAEGEGVSRLLLSKCDRRVSLPLKGEIESLNASVAAGILMYHILEAR